MGKTKQSFRYSIFDFPIKFTHIIAMKLIIIGKKCLYFIDQCNRMFKLKGKTN